MNGGEDISDHDLLIRIDERVAKLDRCLSNHRRGHWAVTLTAISAMFAAVGSMMVALVMTKG